MPLHMPKHDFEGVVRKAAQTERPAQAQVRTARGRAASYRSPPISCRRRRRGGYCRCRLRTHALRASARNGTLLGRFLQLGGGGRRTQDAARRPGLLPEQEGDGAALVAVEHRRR